MTRLPGTPANCPRCGGRLARDNDSGRCAACQAAERDRLIAPPTVPASFWEHEPIRQALTERHLGRMIRAYRCHPYHGRHPLPQTTVARWLGITQAQLSRIENGPAMVHLDRLMHWAQLLHVPAEQLWFSLPGSRHKASMNSAESALRPVKLKPAPLVEDATERNGPVPVQGEPSTAALARLESLRQGVTDAIAEGGSMSSTCLDDWEQVALDHGEATRHRPAPEHLAELTTDFAEIERLLRCRMAASSLRRLTRVTAQMAGLMFLTLIKMGEQGHARHWIRTARIASDEAADPATRSWVRGQEAYVHYYRGQVTKALDVAAEAQTIAERTPCAGVPLAAALEARAQASLGHHQEARSALGRAEAGLDALTGQTTTSPSAFGYDEAQLRFHEGNVYTHLRRWPEARSAQERALALYPPTDFLDRALVHLDQAVCIALEGDASSAAARAYDTLAGLSPTRRTGLLSSRAWQVYDLLPASQRQRGPTGQLYDILTNTSA
jgi:transcriptional regulator with XRE-family HTH domain